MVAHIALYYSRSKTNLYTLTCVHLCLRFTASSDPIERTLRAMTISKVRYLLITVIIFYLNAEINQLYTNSVLASLNSRRALASKTSGPFIESFAASTPTGPLVHVSRHIEFSRPNESQSIEPVDSETRDKVIVIESGTFITLTLFLSGLGHTTEQLRFRDDGLFKEL